MSVIVSSEYYSLSRDRSHGRQVKVMFGPPLAIVATITNLLYGYYN